MNEELVQTFCMAQMLKTQDRLSNKLESNIENKNVNFIPDLIVC